MSFRTAQDDHRGAIADAAADDAVMDEAAPPTNANALWSTSHIFLGTSGAGKSTLANAVAGLPVFATGLCPIGITQDVQYHDLGDGVRLIDTPGIDVENNPEADVAHLLARVPHGRQATVVLVVQIGGEWHRVSDEDKELARIVQTKVAAMAGRDARCAVVFNNATYAARKAIAADPRSFLRQVFDTWTVDDIGTVPSMVVPWFVDAAGDDNVMLPPNVQTDLRAFIESLPLMMLESLHTNATAQQALQLPNEEPQRDGINERPSPGLPWSFALSTFSHTPLAAAAAVSSSSSFAAAAAAPPAASGSALTSTHRSEWLAAQYRGYKDQRWLLVDVYDPSNLGALARSRDVWDNEAVKSIILDQFVFIQVPVCENTEGAEHVVIYEPSTGKRLAMIGGERDRTVKYRKAALLNDPNDVAEFLLEFTAENGVPDEKGGVSVWSGVLARERVSSVPVEATTVGEQVPRPGLQEIEEIGFQTALWASLQGTSVQEEVSADAQASSSGSFPASGAGGVGIMGLQ
ncbi:hypothetical protein AMAG_11217 [Allomyces macrogynus ATCC 38327]|uniref:G domain-containing protein n=1 Tax=Allomyces macrogynus (strain ATCC 38327) TaxID=578462 RepID=A0A0L0SWJ9_ALLM3|nr:hypothetical protein AMAG_11217 [Allomyces macrogynus ATCC 38327]|eukprot:KNE66719.1 hypothetical protein AMAG_11217 [Allomyces macrogynus ATCC 38327]